MLGKIRELFSHTVIFGISSALTSFINIILLPVYAREFPPEQYAYIGLISVTVVLLNIVITAGLDNSVAIWYFDKDSAEERKRTFSSWIWYLFFAGFVAGGLIWLFSRPLSEFLFNNPATDGYLKIAAVQMALIGFQKVVNVYFRVIRKPVGAASYAVGLSVMLVSLALYFIKVRGYGIEGVFMAQAITAVTGFVAFLVIMRKWFSIAMFSGKRLMEMLRFAVPLIPASLGFWAMNYAGAYFLQHFSTEREVGLFQMSYNISAVLGLVSTAFTQAFTPFAASLMKNPNREKIYAASFSYFIAAMVILNLGLYFFIDDIMRWFLSPEYAGIRWLTPVLGLNVILLGIPQVLLIGAAIMKSNKPYFVAILAALPVCMALYYSLIPLYSKEGLATAMIFTNVLIAIIGYLGAQKLLFIPFRLGFTIFSLAACQLVGALILYYFGAPEYLILRAVLYIILITLFVGLLMKQEGISFAMLRGRPINSL